jgi:hypothetical protein
MVHESEPAPCRAGYFQQSGTIAVRPTSPENEVVPARLDIRGHLKHEVG